MKLTGANLIAYWSNPNRQPKDYPPVGMIRLDMTDIPFPDVSVLTAAERDLLRDKITPEVLWHEIAVFGEWVGPAVQ